MHQTENDGDRQVSHRFQVGGKGRERKHSGGKGDGHKEHGDPSEADLQEEEPIDIGKTIDQAHSGHGTDNALGGRDRNGEERSRHHRQRGREFGARSSRRGQLGQLVPNGLHHLVSVAEKKEVIRGEVSEMKRGTANETYSNRPMTMAVPP
jgi:hypothetical protein